jgi:hypothetical protein
MKVGSLHIQLALLAWSLHIELLGTQETGWFLGAPVTPWHCLLKVLHTKEEMRGDCTST